jgi:hypothetical protein
MGWVVNATPRPLFPSGKTRYQLYRRLGGPQGRSGRVRKISPPPGFDPHTVHPVASRYTDWAILAYHTEPVSHKICNVFCRIIIHRRRAFLDTVNHISLEPHALEWPTGSQWHVSRLYTATTVLTCQGHSSDPATLSLAIALKYSRMTLYTYSADTATSYAAILESEEASEFRPLACTDM